MYLYLSVFIRIYLNLPCIYLSLFEIILNLHLFIFIFIIYFNLSEFILSLFCIYLNSEFIWAYSVFICIYPSIYVFVWTYLSLSDFI